MNFVVFVLTCITGACLTVHELHWGLDTGLVVVRCHYAASIFSGCHQETSSLAEHPFIYWFHYALYYAIAFATSAGLVAAIRVAHKLKDLRR
jgi:hypothetical protein